VKASRDEIDAWIERFSQNWKIRRMSRVDRNVLRVAVYELLYCHDIPPKVSINEAIDIAKRYGTEDSGAFINGILDSVRIAIEKEGPVQSDKSGGRTTNPFGLMIDD
jgi:N utilization substance protein B